ncbi:MAG: chaperone modulator CbpM [Sandaracinaceae bacterium]
MTRRFTRVQLAELLELDEAFLVELERHQIVLPGPEHRYDARAVERIRVCWSMHEDLGVNLAGLEVALHLLDQLEAERRRLRELLESYRSDV